MILEVTGALLVGALVLWLVFEPMLADPRRSLAIPEPEAAEESRRGVALLALKEIEFDRETGKLSDQDYASLKERYSAEALAAIAAEEAGAGDPEALIAAQLSRLRSAPSAGAPTDSACPACGPRPEPDALFCSSCGRALGHTGYCAGCGTALGPASLFCAACGNKVAA